MQQKLENTVIPADHMEGMKDATVTIDKVISGTVYIVDYKPTDDGEIIRDHMRLTENKMAAN
ncbi:putative uncharacterized protein [Tetragenococcus halophilus subsp. halophilus]|uniref:DUF1541 domain-containing protein n=2 Tax=Tetragenococcus halophilus TaxID=51669 RepID=A0AAN1SIV6_TETHN|nr:DUF1541 domain-containing protein [Tetragenococcus halophilus]MDN6271042.1 YdhK family protein [Tetragenococcus koreensis]AYW50659.1 DUF1541 domain-containing protein [Tetragenococcus halophilus]MCF1602490.1 YdhK family protein [Tetragenococcus halophilus]MCF1686241.1 YdhK family protein [Tetragenococcus halophilus]MDN6498085.1 YdhK family protein [Tetragenococcus koreensis]